MNHTIKRIILLQCIFTYIFCSGFDSRGLIITQQNDKFQLTKPNTFNADSLTSSFEVSQNGETYVFCPNSEKAKDVGERFKNALYPSKIVTESIIEDSNQCQESIQSVFVKIDNSDLAINNMELYHSGFQLYIKDIKENLNDNNDTSLKYKEWDPHYELILGIAIYFNTNIKQTQAVKYTLYSTNIYDESSPQLKEFRQTSMETTPSFIGFLKNNIYKNILTNIVEGEEANNIISDESRYIIGLPLAPNNHFSVAIWKLPAQIQPNLIPVWNKANSKWGKVQDFTQIVAKNLGDLNVTAGVTGTMSLDGTLLEDKETRFNLPNYVWQVFEFQSFGILVVLNCNPFENGTNKICQEDVCSSNGWPISNPLFVSGEIYCCPLNKNSIENLNVNFLSLEEKPIFNLYNSDWAKENEAIQREFAVKANKWID